AGPPGVRWCAVTDEQGPIVMHSNCGMVGMQLYSRQEMQQLHAGDEEAWRRRDSADGEPVLQIYRQFHPMLPAGLHRLRHMQQY
ncbi:sensor protein ZraS, partial [Escherichia coli]|nr:sensor protein ZraS [Escherichia coli]